MRETSPRRGTSHSKSATLSQSSPDMMDKKFYTIRTAQGAGWRWRLWFAPEVSEISEGKATFRFGDKDEDI